MKSRAINRAKLNQDFPQGGYPRILWLETDPLNADTDGDGLPDGWEGTNGLDPLDNGTVNLRTGGTGDPNQGANGDPDGDGFTNSRNFRTAPSRSFSTATNHRRPIPSSSAPAKPSPAGWPSMKTRSPTGRSRISSPSMSSRARDPTIRAVMFIWHPTAFNSSRDIVAFYARDGGADGKFLFPPRHAGPPPAGRRGQSGHLCRHRHRQSPPMARPRCRMTWISHGNEMGGRRRLLSIRQSAAFIIDTIPSVNSTTVNQQLTGANGVVVRDQNAPNGFGSSYFNHELDAVEFSISRQALLDAGWNGSTKLNYQVFTTRDGTNNTGASGPGAGDSADATTSATRSPTTGWPRIIGARRPTSSSSGRLYNWIGADGNGLYPDQRKAAKMIFLTHGHQPVLPGAETQRLINSGFSTGYHRAIDAHEAFDPAAQPSSDTHARHRHPVGRRRSRRQQALARRAGIQPAPRRPHGRRQHRTARHHLQRSHDRLFLEQL